MRLGFGIRATLFALAVALAGLMSAARADSGTISFRVLKGGWFIGASGGSGTLFFRGRAYPVTIGGLSAGFVFGASATNFHGIVSNIRSPYDVAGVYGAAGAGAALGVGGQAIVLTNEKGAVLSLTGQQIGLQINADLSGLAIFDAVAVPRPRGRPRGRAPRRGPRIARPNGAERNKKGGVHEFAVA